MQQPAQLRLQSGQKLGRQICSIASEKGAENGAPQLSVLTFNVLADGLAQNGGFVRVCERKLDTASSSFNYIVVHSGLCVIISVSVRQNFRQTLNKQTK